MDLILHNKVVIVTGGFSSIGKAISIKLCEEGAIPCVLDSDATAVRTFADEMGAKGYEVFAGEAVADGLPGQTGVGYPGQADPGCSRIMEEILSRYRRINGVVNVAGHHSVVGLAIPSLKESTGAIVNICSCDGSFVDYLPADGLRQELTLRWATAFAVLGIRVNGVVVEHWGDEPEEIANMVLFLLSQRSRLVNGELVYVDG